MEESKRKPIMIAVIVVCLILAGAITYITNTGEPGGIESMKRGTMIWLKCNNPDCKTEYQMDRKDYFVYLKEHPPNSADFIATLTDPNAMPSTPLVCKECGEEAAYRAEKCEKCALIFIRGTIRNDFADRCPECGHSKTESMRKEARESQ
jgi:predicted RNA-binding Zn-ribbon protein involved in translation (DUF1610 family)